MFDWTDENIERLKTMFADGMSGAQIAAELGHGISRNAVIGKLHRLGLTRQRKPPALSTRVPRHNGTVKRRSPRPSAPETQTTPHYLDVSEPAQRPEHLVTLLDLEPHHCRFPFGDPALPDFGFCGAKRFGSEPYCADHCAEAFEGRPRRLTEAERAAKLEQIRIARAKQRKAA